MITAAVLSLLCISYFTRAVTGATTVEISYNEFIEMVDAGKIESVKIESSQIEIKPVSSAQGKENVNGLLASAVRVTYITGKVEDDETLTKRLLDAGVEVAWNSAGWFRHYSLPSILYSANSFDVGSFESAVSQDDRRRRCIQHGQEHSKGLCAERDWHHVSRCRGRG